MDLCRPLGFFVGSLEFCMDSVYIYLNSIWIFVGLRDYLGFSLDSRRFIIKMGMLVQKEGIKKKNF